MKKQRIAESMKVLVETGPGETGGGNMYSKLAIKYSNLQYKKLWRNLHCLLPSRSRGKQASSSHNQSSLGSCFMNRGTAMLSKQGWLNTDKRKTVALSFSDELHTTHAHIAYCSRDARLAPPEPRKKQAAPLQKALQISQNKSRTFVEFFDQLCQLYRVFFHWASP